MDILYTLPSSHTFGQTNQFDSTDLVVSIVQDNFRKEETQYIPFIDSYIVPKAFKTIIVLNNDKNHRMEYKL